MIDKTKDTKLELNLSDGTSIQVLVKFKFKKNLSYKFDNNHLIVYAPINLPSKKIYEILKINEKSILKLIERRKLSIQPSDNIVFLGNVLTVKFHDSDYIYFDDRHIYVRKKDDYECDIDKYIKSYTQKFLKNYVLVICSKYKIFNGYSDVDVTVKNVKSYWGKCFYKKRKIFLNSALIHFSESAIEAIIVHELSHFFHANHSKQFYDFVLNIYPYYFESIKELRKGFIMHITSVNNPQVKRVCQLHQKKNRQKMQQFIVEGEHLVLEAIKSDSVVQIYVLENFQDQIRHNHIVVSADVMKKMTQLTTVPSVIAICHYLKFSDKTLNKVLVLDQVQDPSNVGALMRSALAFGYDAIYLSQFGADIYNSKTVRASQGAVFQLAHFVFDDIEDLIINLKMQGFQIISTSLDGDALGHCSMDLNKHALILGNEGSGVSDCVNKLADTNVYIPIQKIESLNVTVAGSIVMFELSK